MQDVSAMRKTVNEVRVEFNLALARVYKPASQKKGVDQCHEMISANREDRQALRVFMGALTDKSLLQGNPKAMAVAFHASMFGQLAKNFKQNFVDPLDKPGKRTKTFERVLSFFTQHVFTHRIVGQDKEIVDNGCAISMIEILTHVFPEFLQPAEEQNLTSHFITPLLMLL